jgi:peptidoglycan/xylan/chitin deacetylase (PgdA/CDA1 family)
MDRRRFLVVLAAGLVGAAAGRATVGLADIERTPSRAPAAVPQAAAVAVPLVAPVHASPPVPVPPPRGVVDVLPGEGRSLALTIDDGTSSEVVAAYAAFAAESGARLTFFPNGRYRSWEENAEVLRPLIDSGQVALGNHSWSHLDLTKLGDEEVAEEIGRNREFLSNTFGVRDTPFFRPPFGARDARIDRISADQGHPTVVMWNGTLGDARVVSAEELMAAARKWFAEQRIVIGHANDPTVTGLYGQLVGLMVERDLHTVTLADVWAAPAQSPGGAPADGRTGR